jgi:hypothetical protein
MKSSINIKLVFFFSLLVFTNCGFSLDTTLNEFCIHPLNTANTQTTGRSAQLKNSNIVVVWQSLSPVQNIFGKIYASDMTTIVLNDFLVNKSAMTPLLPAVAALSNGNFVAAWLATYSAQNMAFNIFTPTGTRLLSADALPNAVKTTQTEPHIIPLQDKFIALFIMTNVYAVIYNNDGTVATPLFRLDTGSNSCASITGTSLTNGSWAVAWQSLGTSGTEIWLRVFDAAGNAIQFASGSNKEFVVNTTTSGNQNRPSINHLRNNKFIITWTDYSANTKGKIMAQAFNNDGSIDGPNFQVNASNSLATYDQSWVTGLTYSGFIVSWTMNLDSTVENVYAQIYDRYYNKLGNEFMVNKDTTNTQNNASSISLSNNSFVLLFDSKATGDFNVNSVVYKYNSVLSCKPFTTTAGINTPTPLAFVPNILHEFLLPSEMNIAIMSAPSIGQFSDINGNALVTANIYSAMGNTYLSNQAGSGITFTYVSSDNTTTSAPCTVTVSFNISCYLSCNTCSNVGDNVNHKCTSCAANYYPTVDNTTNCYASSAVVPSYFFSSPNFKKCYIACSQCTALGDNINMLCTSCAAGYYPLEDDNTKCYASDAVIDNYFFNTDKFSKCLVNCKYCTGLGSDADHMCSTCSENYFTIVDNPTFCFTKDIALLGYYFSVDSFQKCYDSCRTCSGSGDKINQNCTSCRNGYYALEDNTTLCYAGTDKIPAYYFNSDASLFKKCNPSCATCNNSNSCLTCNDGYYPLADDPTQCAAGTASVDNYFFSLPAASYVRCYSTCKTCSAIGTDTQNNCLTCASGYYSLEDNATQCYPPNLVMIGYYWDINNLRYSKCYSSCATCSTVGNDNLHNCNSCLANYFTLQNNSSYCFAKTVLLYNYFWDEANQRFSSCYASCLTCSMAGTASQNNCTSCKANFYALQDNSSMCFAPSLSMTNYFWDSTNSRYSNCYSSCSTCNQAGSSSAHNCLACNSNLYPLQDNATMCFAPNLQVDNYFWDTANTRYSNCYTSCKSCTSLGNSTSMGCQACKAGYYPLPDVSSQCFAANTTMNNYFWNSTNNAYVKCYQSCQTCSSLGDSNNNKCSSCQSGYYPLPDNAAQCLLPNSIVDGYFWDATNSKYIKCYNSCSRCTTLGNSANNQCQACAINYFSLPDNTSQCFPSNTTMNSYFWDSTNSRYLQCYQACKTCSASGAVDNSQCTTCNDGYYPLPDNSPQCYPPGTSLNLYFWDSTNTKYVKCHQACKTCASLGDATMTQCTQCNTGYFPLIDNSAQCLLPNVAVTGYYWNSANSIYSKCFSSCKTCSQAGDSTHNNCLTCSANFFNLQDDTTSCLAPNLSMISYIWDANNNIYSKCYSSCATCSAPGTQTSHKCLTCAPNNYPLPDNSTQCYPANTSVNFYFWDVFSTSYIKCYQSCKTCSTLGNLANNMCSTCNTNYYPLVDNSAQCNLSSTKIGSYFYDSANSRFSKCYSSCATCTNGGTQATHNCDICATSYFPLQDNPSMCYQPANHVDYYYFDSANHRFSICQNLCKSCDLDVTTAQTCNNCNSGLYPLQNNPSQCFPTTQAVDYYFFDSGHSRFSLCYLSCKQCDALGDASDSMCSSCKDNYYPLVDNQSQCYPSSAQVEHYYFDSNQFKKCYVSCDTCQRSGDSTTHNCTKCDTGFFSLVNDSSLCYAADTQMQYYYFNGQQFDFCFSSCSTCSDGGDENHHNCIECDTNYFPLENDNSMCYQMTSNIPGYIFETDIFKQCHEGCAECSDPGSDTSHNCLLCKNGYYPLNDNSSFCYQSTDIVPLYYFDATSELFKPCYSNCETCSAEGNDNNNNCLQCKANFYALEDNPSMCYDKTIQIKYHFADSVNNRFSLCYLSCSTCSGIGKSDSHKCSSCKTGYYQLADNSAMCYSSKDNVANYYFDPINSIFKKCNESCQYCSNGSDCTVCKADYYPLEDNASQCVSKDKTLIGYFLDILNSRFSQCLGSCYTCTALGTVNDMKCASCNSGYYPLVDNISMCYESSSFVPGYYFDTDKFYKCHSLCTFCSGAGTDADPQCSSCTAGFYALEDNQSLCYQITDVVPGYFYNSSTETFSKCYTACKQCNGSGSADASNCSQCALDYFPLVDKASQCYPKTASINAYYFNVNDNVFEKCFETCNKCSNAGDASNNNCLSCNSGFYPLEDNKAMCHPEIEKIDGYFFDGPNAKFSKCHPSCQTCSTRGDDTNQQCLTCKFGFYKLENSDTQCYSNDAAVPAYYFDSQALIFKHCYSGCLTCTGAGTATQHNCSKCLSGFSSLIDDSTTCLPNDGTVEGFYYNSSSNKFEKCYNSCFECSAAGDSAVNNCTRCKDGFFPLEDNNTQCNPSTMAIDFYIFDTNIFAKCYESCKTCNLGGTVTDHKCITCADDFSPDPHKPSNCLANAEPMFGSGAPQQPCYDSCSQCSGPGTADKQNCTVCKNGYAALSDDSTMCFLNNSSVMYYYYNGTSFSKCYDTCMVCTETGDQTNNKCTTCKDGYALNPLQQNNCISITNPPDGYAYDSVSKSFKKCYDSCSTCSKLGTSSDQGCLKCQPNYLLAEGGSNCFLPTDKPEKYFFDSTANTFKQCHKNCKYCNESGTDSINNCTTCANGFIQAADNPLNCVAMPSDTGVISCYQSCSECSAAGGDLIHNCTKCAPLYYPLENISSQCYKSDASVEGFYFDKSTLVFKKCDGACKTCSAPATLASTNCSVCATGFTASVNDSTNCIGQNSNDNCYKLCATCTEKGTDLDHKCTTCIDGFHMVNILGKESCVNDSINIEEYRYDYTIWLLISLVFVFI